MLRRMGAPTAAPPDAVRSPVGKARNACVWLAVVTGSSTALPVIAPSLLMSCARVRRETISGNPERVEIPHHAVLEQKGMTGAPCRARRADDLALVVDAQRKRRRMVRIERSEISDPFASRPHERAQPGSVRVVARLAGETHDDTVPVDRRRRVPGVPSQRADVVHRAVLPDHRVPRGVSADCLIARAGDAHRLTFVVDRGRGAGGVILRPERQLTDLLRSRSPDHGAELDRAGRRARYQV